MHAAAAGSEPAPSSTATLVLSCVEILEPFGVAEREGKGREGAVGLARKAGEEGFGSVGVLGMEEEGEGEGRTVSAVGGG